jgi:hypothetical protein
VSFPAANSYPASWSGAFEPVVGSSAQRLPVHKFALFLGIFLSSRDGSSAENHLDDFAVCTMFARRLAAPSQKDFHEPWIKRNMVARVFGFHLIHSTVPYASLDQKSQLIKIEVAPTVRQSHSLSSQGI